MKNKTTIIDITNENLQKNIEKAQKEIEKFEKKLERVKQALQTGKNPYCYTEQNTYCYTEQNIRRIKHNLMYYRAKIEEYKRKKL